MKKIIPALFITVPIICFGQKGNDSLSFGNITQTEIKMSACDFDKNAEAVVLFDVEEVKCVIYPASIYTDVDRHIRIKILNDKGLDQANIKITYFSYLKTEAISNIIAQTYNADAAGKLTAVKLDKKNIYDKEVNKRVSQRIFTFPEARKGSIIEYSYRISSSVEGGLRNWNFQKSIPVKFSRYTTNFPEEIEVNSEAKCVLPVLREYRKEGYNNVHTFTMRNVPALRDEPYISCEDDYLQRMESRVVAINIPGQRRINLTRSWRSIVRELMNDEDFGQQLTRNIPRTDSLEMALKKIDSPYQKMATIFRYVRNNMQWNGRSSIWALAGVKSAWKEKKGTTGEINLILINLLKDAGLNVRPILVSTRDNGAVNTYTAGYDQFDKVMAFVKINEQEYVLDATDKYASPDLIPWEVMFSQGLIIERPETFEWGWHDLWNEKKQFNNLIIINATITDKGIMDGSASVYCYEYARSKRLPDLKQGKEKYIEKYFTTANPGIKVDSVTFENENIDTMPLAQNIKFTQTLSSSGEYKYFNTNLFTGLEKNPFTADYRFSDIFFGANQTYTIVENFTIPDGYAFDELPKNIKMIMPDTSIVFSRIMGANEEQLAMRTTLQFKKPFYKAEDYGYFREFYKKLFDLLNEQIVIKKKH